MPGNAIAELILQYVALKGLVFSKVFLQIIRLYKVVKMKYNNKVMQLILASASPRRRELLSKLPYPFEIIPAEGEEVSSQTEPTEIVKELAAHKAQEVFAVHPDAVVLGCDTVVDFDGQVMGKPRDREDALHMLRALSGNVHFVHTGVCVLSSVRNWLFCDSTEVHFRVLSEEEIVKYVDAGEAYGKAGAYGIQDDSRFVSHIVGDYDNVVGLPIYRIKEILETIYKR